MITLNDPLNLRGFIDIVTDYCRENGTEPQSAVSFLDLLLNDLERKLKGIVKVPNTLSIQRVYQGYSNPLGVLKPFWDGVLSGSFDDPLLENISLIITKIGPSIGNLCRILLAQAYYPFFTKQAISELEEDLRNAAYQSILLRILKHGFETVTYSSPVVHGENLYLQALTLTYGTAPRHALMTLAAQEGSSHAAQELAENMARKLLEDKTAGKEISKEDVNACLHFFLDAGFASSLWNISFLLETYLDETDIPPIERLIKIDAKLKNVELPEILTTLVVASGNPRPRITRLCLRLHQYLAAKDGGFSKSFNSLARMLAQGLLDVDPQSSLSRQEVDNFFRIEAIKRGDLFAIQNEGSALLKSFQNGEQIDHEYAQRILKLGRDFGVSRSCLNSGLYFESYNREVQSNFSSEEIRSAFESAISELPGHEWINATAFLHLALMQPDENVEERIQLFNKSIQCGNSDAAYHLALLYYDQYQIDKDEAQLLESHRLLEKHLSSMTQRIKQFASVLLKKIESILKSTY